MTHNLALGVGVGVILSGLFFAFKVSSLVNVTSTLNKEGQARVDTVSGPIFFASADAVSEAIDAAPLAPLVRIDLSQSHIWDVSAIGALERAAGRLRARGARVELVGLNEASAAIVNRLSPEMDGPLEPLVD